MKAQPGTALARELAARFASAFALLHDLERLAPDEHAAIMRAVVAEVRQITSAAARRLEEQQK